MPPKKSAPQGVDISPSEISTSQKLAAIGVERFPQATGRTRTLADAYQSTTEQINPLIERAEQGLRALGLNVSGSVHLETHEDWSSHLSFRKVDKEWRLLLDVGPDDDPVGLNWTAKPLITTSREMRLKALAQLPLLEKALVARVEEQLAEACETVTDAAAYVADLEARTK